MTGSKKGNSPQKRGMLFAERRDPTLSRSSSFSMGGRYPREIDKLASNNPFFQQGTHRAEYGEELLTHARGFDRASQDALRAQGRQWKATPGPGAYRTQRVIGETQLGDNASIAATRIYKEPSWQFGKGPMCTYMRDQAGTSWNSPGPGSYRTWSHFVPEGKQVPRFTSPAVSQDEMCSPNLPRSMSVTIPIKTVNDTDRLASCNPLFPNGTHRANYGETFLTNGRIRDDKTIDALTAQGRHWKQTPGAGTYRTPVAIADPGVNIVAGETKLDRNRIYHEPAWKFGTGAQIAFDTMPGVVVDSPGPCAYSKYVDIQ
ncbi:unnamed protein product [Amoebophrya sp. A25]|nr:unnamed protein product [Amoebophrya sp. A25]|eukprot:GSA25T00002367001.1